MDNQIFTKTSMKELGELYYNHVLNEVENADTHLLNAVIRTIKPRNVECITQEDYYVALCKILYFKKLPSEVWTDVEREYDEIFVQKYGVVMQKFQTEINKIDTELTQTKTSADAIKNATPSYSFMRDISTEEQKLYELSSKCNSLRTRKEMLTFVIDYVTSKLSDFCDMQDMQSVENAKKQETLKLSKEDSYGDKWFWAPEVYYVEEDKKFYMFYSVEEHVCVATSDSPLGPFVQDEKKPIREEKGIDTSVFFDEDGKAYLYFVRFTNGNVIWCAELKDNLKEIKEETLTQCVEATEPWELVFGKVAEGPSIVKQDGLYYMFYSANDFRSQDYAVGYATSDSPFGPWRKSKKNPLLHKVEELVGTGHGAPFLDRSGGYRYIFHAHKSRTEVNQRNSYIIDMSLAGKERVSIGGGLIRPEVVK